MSFTCLKKTERNSIQRILELNLDVWAWCDTSIIMSALKILFKYVPNRRNASGEKIWNAFWGEDFGEKVGHCKRFIKT